GGGGYSSVVGTVDSHGIATIAWHQYTPVPGSAQYDLYAKSQNPDGSWPQAHEVVETAATGNSAVENSTLGNAIAAGPHDDVVIASTITKPPSSGISGSSVVTYTRLTAAGGWVK